MEVIVSFTSLQNMRIFVNISHGTTVVYPHNGTYDLYIFAIFSKFVDIIPLCIKMFVIDLRFLTSCQCITIFGVLEELLLRTCVHMLKVVSCV